MVVPVDSDAVVASRRIVVFVVPRANTVSLYTRTLSLAVCLEGAVAETLLNLSVRVNARELSEAIGLT